MLTYIALSGIKEEYELWQVVQMTWLVYSHILVEGPAGLTTNLVHMVFACCSTDTNGSGRSDLAAIELMFAYFKSAFDPKEISHELLIALFSEALFDSTKFIYI